MHKRHPLAYVLPAQLKRIIHKHMHALAHRFYAAPHPELNLRDAKARGFCPRTILDIGGYKGDWARTAHEIWPDAEITIFEANEEREPALKAAATAIGGTYHIGLLGAEDGVEVPFTVLDSGSSVFEPRNSFARTQTTKTLKTVDTLMAALPRVDFMKLDTQGYELEILRGASRLMPTAQAILLEVAFLEINKGGPLLHDVTAFMKERGFVAYDVVEIHPRLKDRATGRIDLMFVPEARPLIADKSYD